MPEKAVLGKISKISPAIGVRPVDKMSPKKKSAASDSDSDDSFIDDDSEDYGVSDDGSNGTSAHLCKLDSIESAALQLWVWLFSQEPK